MTSLKRIVVLFVAVLLLAHGLTTADSHPAMHIRSVAQLERALVHHAVAEHVARGGKQCRETGCTFAACQGHCAVMPMIVPDLPVANPPIDIACFGAQVQQQFVDRFFAPPVPPPKSPSFETTGGFSA